MTVDGSASGIITKAAKGTVNEVVDRLTDLIAAGGMKLFALIDHSGEADKAGLALRETKVVIFGSPAAGTPVMEASPLAALDLPLRILVWDDGGRTRVSFADPSTLASRYDLSPDLAQRLAGIVVLADALAGG